MKTNEETSLDMIEKLIPILEDIGQWDVTAIHDRLMAAAKELEVKNGYLLWPLRVALSGKAFTPGGGIELCAILGKADTLARLNKALEKLRA